MYDAFIVYKPDLRFNLYSAFSFEIVEYVAPSECLKLICEKYMFSDFDFVKPFTVICPIANVGNSNKNNKKYFIKLFKLVPQ
jgi:hypothetical protein